MKSKLIFIIILGLVIFGVLFMSFGQVPFADYIGAAVTLIGGGVAVYDCLKQRRNKWVLVLLTLGILVLVITSFIRFKGVIILFVFGLATLGLYIYLRLYKAKHK